MVSLIDPVSRMSWMGHGGRVGTGTRLTFLVATWSSENSNGEAEGSDDGGELHFWKGYWG